MEYSSCVIYFLTGTGNSYRAAAWMAEIVKSKRVTVHGFARSGQNGKNCGKAC